MVLSVGSKLSETETTMSPMLCTMHRGSRNTFFELVVLNWGDFASRDIWQSLEIFLMVTTVSSRQKLRICTFHPPNG